jgi:glutathione S-transferase
MATDGGGPIGKVFHAEVQRILGYVADELGDSPWLLGDEFSAADVMMGYVVDTAEKRGELVDHPRLRAYVERLRERPAYLRAREAE